MRRKGFWQILSLPIDGLSAAPHRRWSARPRRSPLWLARLRVRCRWGVPRTDL